MSVANLVVGILVLGFIIYRQLMARPVRDNFRIPLILAIIGIIETYNYLKDHHTHNTVTLAVALAGSLVLAGLFGAARAAVTKVWVQDGRAWRQGNWLTAVLWVVTLAAHLGYDALVYRHTELGNVTILLYLAVSFGVQRVILQARAQRLPVTAQPSQPVGGPPGW